AGEGPRSKREYQTRRRRRPFVSGTSPELRERAGTASLRGPVGPSLLRRDLLRVVVARGLVALELVVEGLGAHAEDLGGTRSVVAHRGECLDDELTLGLVHRHPNGKRDRVGRRSLLRCAWNGREVVRRELIAGDRNHGPLDPVPELTDVARPRILTESRQ